MSSRHPTHAGDVDTVDLTLSSPEPQLSSEPRSKSQSQSCHARPQHPPSSSRETRGSSPRRPVAGPSKRPYPQLPIGTVSPRPTISQEHLRNIVSTAPARELRELLLHLCASSPALSGAVVRGLAPHSTWAQETINDYNRRNERAKVKLEHRSPLPACGPKSSARSQSRGYPTTPQPKSSLKCEIDTLETDSDDTLSDLEVLSAKPVRPSNHSAKDLAGPSSSVNHVSNEGTPTNNHAQQRSVNSPLPVRTSSGLRTSAPICITCNQTIRPGSRCRYHIGRKKTEKRGSEKIQTWSCCGGTFSDVGCCDEDHIPLRNTNFEGTPPASMSKKPRLV